VTRLYSRAVTDERHARLAALREGLLAVHKALLGIASADYERDKGPLGGPATLLQLLIHDEAFAWLQPVSALAARADELVEEEEISEAEAAAMGKTASELLTADEHGTGFAKRYFDALQQSPEVVMAHADAKRAIAGLERASGSGGGR
jgi:hypothetical protein